MSKLQSTLIAAETEELKSCVHLNEIKVNDKSNEIDGSETSLYASLCHNDWGRFSVTEPAGSSRRVKDEQHFCTCGSSHFCSKVSQFEKVSEATPDGQSSRNKSKKKREHQMCEQRRKSIYLQF